MSDFHPPQPSDPNQPWQQPQNPPPQGMPPQDPSQFQPQQHSPPSQPQYHPPQSDQQYQDQSYQGQGQPSPEQPSPGQLASDMAQAGANDAMKVLNSVGSAGLIEGLMDFGFKKTVTQSIAKVLYLLAFVVVALLTLFFVIGALLTGKILTILFALILAPLVGLIYLIGIRVMVETIVVQFKQAEFLAELVEQGRKRQE